MDITKLLKIKCHWPSNVDGKDIEDCVAVHIIPETNQHEGNQVNVMPSIEQTVCNCVNFMKPEDNNEAPLINISCDSKHFISKICVFSEAKIIELFGINGEYVSTHSTISTANVSEYLTNSHMIYINSTECSLKFRQLSNADFIWIYSIIVYLTESKIPPNRSLGPINMQNVEHLLNPELLAKNASKLFTTLSLNESKPNKNDILNYLDNINLPNSDYSCSQLMYNNIKQFEIKIEDRLNAMALQLNTINNNVEMLNKKIDELLIVVHEKNS